VVTAELSDGVFCLAGANGLGKSTFLAAINFGFTGIVSDPDRKFESAEEYYRYSVDFSGDYFSGRVSEGDRETAEIVLEFAVGQREYKLRRGMFDSNSLRELQIYDSSNGARKRVKIDEDEPENLHELFRQKI
jgi:DNA repair exonuclease SbcCD ATPase subunit